MPAIRSVAAFCGSRLGNHPDYAAAAAAFGVGVARAGLRLVYGAGRNGLMGVMANAALAAGGEVVGVIPGFLRDWEVAHLGLSRLEVVGSMHERKSRMFALSDAAVMLPGGLGTLDETLEMITWRQLRLHEAPIILCDVRGSAGPLLAAIEGSIAAGFAGAEARQFFHVADGVAATLALLVRLEVAGAPGSGARL